MPSCFKDSDGEDGGLGMVETCPISLVRAIEKSLILRLQGLSYVVVISLIGLFCSMSKPTAKDNKFTLEKGSFCTLEFVD